MTLQRSGSKPYTDISAAILAGGENSRFGSPKAFIPINGEPLIVRNLRILRAIFSHVVISTNDPAPYFPLGARLIGDVLPSKGPMAGIHAALLNAPSDSFFVIACDMPAIDPEVIWRICEFHRQAGSATATVPLFRGAPQPLFGVYCKSVLPALEEAVHEDKAALKLFLDEVGAFLVDEAGLGVSDPEGRTFTNINTPEDFRILGSGSGA